MGPEKDIATAEEPNAQKPPSPISRDKNPPQSIEEGSHAYKPGGFHPVYIGDVFHDRYKILSKIGYGVYSTVWLARDLRKPTDESPEFLALKILTAMAYGAEKDIFEREILKHLKEGDPDETGYDHICHLLDDFEHEGPNGKHVCLVFELMGESLASFGAWFPDCRIPESVMRRFTIELIIALDYAHDHNVIHTDIQPSNIFVKIRDYSLVKSGYLLEVEIPQQDRDEEQYTVIPSRTLRRYYFNTDDNFANFDIVLGDWGVASWGDNHLTEFIQPVALRSPEVLIKAPWDATTDLWNLGAVLLEVFCAVLMFDGCTPDGEYKPKEHVREMVDLFGPFPKAFLDRGDHELVQELFDDEGGIKDALPMRRPPLLSEAFMPGLKQEVREDFASFLFLLMKINPTERVTTIQLLKHHWLNAIA